MQYQDKFFFQQQKLNTLGLKMQNYSFRKKDFPEHFRAWKKWWIFHVLLKRKEINCAEFSPRKENKKWKKMSTFSQQMMHFEATTNDELEISLPHDWRSEFSWCTWLRATSFFVNNEPSFINVNLYCSDFPFSKLWNKIIGSRMKSHKTVDSFVKINKANIQCYASYS